MNHLESVGAEAWRLERHAKVIVYEAEDGGTLLTVYDCAAAQKPPSLQEAGHLVRVSAAHERRITPTGYEVTLGEEAVLERQPDDRYVIRNLEGR
ncbi:MAG: hypothetical protein ABEJ60_01910 [Halodesulfurarchaeum sp.]